MIIVKCEAKFACINVCRFLFINGIELKHTSETTMPKNFYYFLIFDVVFQ